MKLRFVLLILFGIALSACTSGPVFPLVQAKPSTQAGNKNIDVLIRNSQSPDLAVRKAAAEGLGQSKDPRAVDALIGLLRDLDIRDQAILSLAQIGAPAVGPLISALQDRNIAIREGAANALGKIKDSQAVDPLIAALQDEEMGVQIEAAAALAEIGDARAIAPLIAMLIGNDSIVMDQVMASLVKIGSPAVEPLISSVQNPAGDVRRRVVEVLGKIPDERTIPALIAALADPDTLVQFTAQDSLTAKGASAVDPLAAVLKDTDPARRGQAATLLGQIGNARAVPPLIAALDDSEEIVRWDVSTALAAIGAPAVDALIDALSSTNAAIRAGSAEALGQIGDARAVEPLIAALGDADAPVQVAAAIALGKLKDPRAVDALIAAFKRDESGLGYYSYEALAQIGEPAIGPLIAALHDKGQNVATYAANALAEIGSSALRPLIEAYQDPDPEVRAAAVQAFGQMDDPGSVDPLIMALGDEDIQIRKVAINYLEEKADPRVVDALIPLLKDPAVQVEVAGALGHLKDPRAFEPLIAALNSLDSTSGNGYSFVQALLQFDDSRIIQPLIGAFRLVNSNNQSDAVKGLVKIGGPAVEPLIAALQSPDGSTRRWSARALEDIGDSRADEPLMAGLKRGDLEVVAGAYAFFINKGEPGTENTLINALNQHGDKGMGEAFLNCGNDRLEQAARDWASKHGYVIVSGGLAGGPIWGSLR
jgi:HEAT repeat protein